MKEELRLAHALTSHSHTCCRGEGWKGEEEAEEEEEEEEEEAEAHAE